jgi:chromosome segregation ATPase
MFGLVTRRRYAEDLAAAKAEADRQRRRAETAEGHAATAVFNRKQALRQLAEADAANRRLHDRNLELGRRLSLCDEADPEYAATLERRVARLRKVGDRILDAYRSEKRRADRLQEQYDDACGPNDPRVLDGQRWQQNRQDGGRKGVAV